MELRETIESINYRLEKEFGKEFNNSPRWRVVFSDDMFEKRLTNYTDEGFELIFPEVRLLPKYKQHIHQRYILERLIPIIGETDLVTNISYEPAWTFQDKNGNYLPPWFDGCKFVIETIYSQISKAGTHVKYHDPLTTKEDRFKQIDNMEKELFGNETDVGDALAYDSGVTVPEMPEKLEVAKGEDNGNGHI